MVLISLTVIQCNFTGKSRDTSFQQSILQKLTRALGVSITELLDEPKSKATGVKDQPTSL
ncbi:MAG: hypothetical protein GX295_11795 [Syntrophomonadaceae bacterium]|nr:hypothetical protein [Syntrophomonadaceae bacterium]